MDENLGVAKKLETSPAHIEGPRLGQCTLNLEQHPAIVDVEQKENPVTNLYQQSREKEKLVEILKEESRLLKAKLKGFEALAYLYQQSKNESMTLKKLCSKLNDEKEMYRKMCLLSDNELHNKHSCPRSFERNISDATEPVGIFCEQNKLSSEAVGDKAADLHDHSVAAVVPNEAFPPSVGDCCGEPEEPVELKSGEFKQGFSSLDNRTIEDEYQSSFSLLGIQSSLATSIDDLRNSDHEKTHDLEISTDVSGNNHQNQDRGTLLCESHRPHQMESSATQTLDPTDTMESIQGQSSDHGKTPKVDQTCGSSNSKQRKSLIVADDLSTEVQILRQQVMTFKDDFERERRDREKVRSEYDLLKWHYERVSTDFRHLKDKLRSTEIKLEESEREKAALRHNISKTASELRKLKKGSLCTSSSRSELRPQHVPPLAARKTWPCVYCTYLNPHPRQTCEMCGQAAAHRFPLQVK